MHDAYQDSNHHSYKNVAYHLEFLTMRPKGIWLKKFKGQPIPQQNDQQKRWCPFLLSTTFRGRFPPTHLNQRKKVRFLHHLNPDHFFLRRVSEISTAPPELRQLEESNFIP